MKNKIPYPSRMLKDYWAIPLFVSIFVIIFTIISLFSYINQDNLEYIYFTKDNAIWRVNSVSNATPELLAEIDKINPLTYFARSGDNLIYLTEGCA